MTDDDMPVNEEHFDSIPWSSLIPQRPDRPWLVYVAAAAVVALVVGVLAARNLQSASQALDPVAVATEDPAEPVASPPTTRSVSEADLRADIQHGEAGAAAAMMRAEWFVTDYFTRDGAGGRQAELAGALGRPAPATEAEVTTYVEWARAWEAVAEFDGRYRVSVAFRSITATDAGFVRDIAKGVAVRVQVAADGGSRVVDLPEPIQIPASPVLAALASPEPIPEWVATKALDQAALWGESATVVKGISDGDHWRVLVEATDDHGTEWPLVVWIEESEAQ